MEREPTPELTYESPRNEALHAMWRSGWAVASSGEPDSPTGPFARVSNSEDELAELTRAFSDEFSAIGVDPQELVGHFMLGVSTEGEGVVMELGSEQALVQAYEALRDVYVAWKEGML